MAKSRAWAGLTGREAGRERNSGPSAGAFWGRMTIRARTRAMEAGGEACREEEAVPERPTAPVLVWFVLRA